MTPCLLLSLNHYSSNFLSHPFSLVYKRQYLHNNYGITYYFCSLDYSSRKLKKISFPDRILTDINLPVEVDPFVSFNLNDQS